jgi:hypothetical protein
MPQGLKMQLLLLMMIFLHRMSESLQVTDNTIDRPQGEVMTGPHPLLRLPLSVQLLHLDHQVQQRQHRQHRHDGCKYVPC